jgi:hypothetical protein
MQGTSPASNPCLSDGGMVPTHPSPFVRGRQARNSVQSKDNQQIYLLGNSRFFPNKIQPIALFKHLYSQVGEKRARQANHRHTLGGPWGKPSFLLLVENNGF